MKKKYYVLQGFVMTLAIIFSEAFYEGGMAQCPSQIGAYYWGGLLNGVPTNQIIPTAKGLADALNVNTIRISLASNSDIQYFGGSTCILSSNLTELASRADFNAIITDPQFSTVIITAYDWTSFGDCATHNYLDTAFFTPANTAAVEQEFTDFANYLGQFTNKTFIISNWEGDNAVYCGAAYYYPDCATAPKNILGFKKWMDARAAGIRASSATNVKVGIEFCNVHSLEGLGKPSVLNNVVPTVDADYFLYSSYESINVSAAQFATDIDYIRDKLYSYGKDTTKLLIGEMGYDKVSWGGPSAAAVKLQEIINVVKQKSIPYAITWVLIDTPYNFGLYDDNSALTPCGQVIKDNVCTPFAEFSTATTQVCHGSAASFTDNSINSPTSWSWSFEGGTPATSAVSNPGVTYNTAGTYDVTLIVSNAYGSDTIVKTDYITVTNFIAAISNPLDTIGGYSYNPCHGESNGQLYVQTAGETGNVAYLWSNSQTGQLATNLADGTYSVTCTDDLGCTATATKQVVETNYTASITSSAGPTTIGGSDGYATVSCTNCPTADPNTYLWSNAQTTQTAINLAAGSYVVTVSIANTLCTDTARVTLLDPTATAIANASAGEVSISPNPSTGNILVQLNAVSNATVEIMLYNDLGEKVMEKKYTNVSGNFIRPMDLTELPKGVYWLKIKRSDKSYIAKILLQ